MSLSKEEVWLRAYCAGLTGSMANAKSLGRYSSREEAIEAASNAVEDFEKQFPGAMINLLPKFSFASSGPEKDSAIDIAHEDLSKD